MSSFRFYCRRPTDWYEGANMGHLISIAFEKQIDEAMEQMIARCIYDAVAFEKVLFSGRAMKLFTGGGGLSFLGRVETFARKLHPNVRITDVVFHGMREGTSGYDEAPVAVADMNFGSGFPRPVDPGAPAWSEGKAFTAEVKKLHAARTNERLVQRDTQGIEKALSKQKDGPIQVQRASRPETEAADISGFELAPLAEPGAPPAKGDHPLPTSAPPRKGVRNVARVYDGASYFSTKLATVHEGRRVEYEVGLPLHHVSVSPDGAWATFGSNMFVGRLDLANGEVTPLPAPNAHEGLRGVAALADGHWAALNASGLYIFDAEQTLLAHKKLKADAIAPFAEGYGVGVWKQQVFTAFRFVHGKLKQLHKFGFAPRPAFEAGDALYFHTHVGDLALVGAHKDIAEERDQEPRKQKAKTIPCELLRWSIVNDVRAPEPAPVELPAGVTADRAAASPSGEWVAFQSSAGLSVLHRPTSDITPALPECTDFFMNDSGRLIAFGFGQIMFRRKPEHKGPEWRGPRHSVSLQKGRASYLHDHDILVFLPNDRTPVPFACTDQIYSLPSLYGLRDAFEKDGRVYLQWERCTIHVDGLREVAAQLAN